MPGLVFIVKYESPSHFYPVNVCESCASEAHDFSRCTIPREAYANATTQCPVCGKCSNLIVYLRTIHNPDLLVDIDELKNLFSYAKTEFTLVNILNALDQRKVSILSGSGLSAMAYLRKWRDDNPDANLPDEHFRHLALIREDPGLRSGSALDHRVGDLKNHMMKHAQDRIRKTIMSSSSSAAFKEVDNLLTLHTLAGIRSGDRSGSIHYPKFANL